MVKHSLNPSQGDDAVDSTDATPSTASSARARAAKRLSKWSMNLLATGLVVLLGLTLGRTLLHWWQHDSDDQVDPVSSSRELGFGHQSFSDGPAIVEFGTQPLAFRHHEFTGDKDAAMEQFVKACAGTARNAIGWDHHDPGPSERKMLHGLTDKQPVAGELGKWQVYQHDGPIPMVVGVQQEGQPQPNAGPIGNIDETKHRVVCWGLAIQQSETSWTLVTASHSGTAATVETGLPELPLPPAARRTVSLTGSDGGGIVGFTGHGGLLEWKPILANWFDKHDWVLVKEWRRIGSGFFARYRTNAGLQIDVQLVPGRDGISGLLTSHPDQL